LIQKKEVANAKKGGVIIYLSLSSILFGRKEYIV